MSKDENIKGASDQNPETPKDTSKQQTAMPEKGDQPPATANHVYLSAETYQSLRVNDILYESEKKLREFVWASIGFIIFLAVTFAGLATFSVKAYFDSKTAKLLEPFQKQIDEKNTLVKDLEGKIVILQKNAETITAHYETINLTFKNIQQEATRAFQQVRDIQTAASAIQGLKDATSIVQSIREQVATDVIPALVNSELSKHIGMLNRLPKEGQNLTHSGFSQVVAGKKCMVSPPWGTTENWEIIVVPMSLGYKPVLPDNKVYVVNKAPQEELGGRIDSYVCYPYRIDSNNWEIIATQTNGFKAENTVEVFYFMVAKLN